MSSQPFIDPAVTHLPNGMEVRQGRFFVARCARADTGEAFTATISEHYVGWANDGFADAGAFHYAVSRNDRILSIEPAQGWAARSFGNTCWVQVCDTVEEAISLCEADRVAKQPSDEAFRAAFPSLFPAVEA